MNGRLNLAVTVLLVMCALALVNAQYHARSLFIALERAQAAARQLDIEWSQLQLDQSTLGKHARIEASARHDLHMLPVTAARTQYLVADGLSGGAPAADGANPGASPGANAAMNAAPDVALDPAANAAANAATGRSAERRSRAAAAPSRQAP